MVMEAFKRKHFFNFGGYEEGCPLNYIHPFKVKGLEKILLNLPDFVEMLIVFGSSVRDYQREDSDLDLAVIPCDNEFSIKRIIKEMVLDFKVDIFDFESLDDLVEQADGYFPTPRDILEEGVLVYYKGGRVYI
jgi:predicted nucleotidyltransferase